MNLKVEEVVVFEDLLTPILTAKKAGFKVIGVYDKHNKSNIDEIKENCDYFLTSYKDLIE